MKCKICNSSAQKISEQLMLQKYKVNYYQCATCAFIQTEEPYWLTEAYESAITSLDIGLISRNLYQQEQIPKIIDTFFPESKVMLDYGGGYGMFVRLMRDLGYNFYRQDIYCDNLFAKHFDIADSGAKKFDLLTAFEVFEHLADPLKEVETMFTLADHIVFTTLLAPESKTEFDNWWYVSPLTGQHIAFYQLKTLQVIAGKFDKRLYSNGYNLHVFTSKHVKPTSVAKVFSTAEQSLFQKLYSAMFKTKAKQNQKSSLLQQDYKLIEAKLIKNNSHI